MSTHEPGTFRRCRTRETYENSHTLIKKYKVHQTEELKRQLVHRYMPLVQSIAARFSRKRPFYEDFIQVGIIGLLAALKRYDPSYGHRFEVFAVPTITGEIKRYIRDTAWSVHVPRRVKELGPRITKALDELTPILERKPYVSEIADFLAVSESEVLEAIEMIKGYRALSIHHPIETVDESGDDGTVTMFDFIGEIEPCYDRIERKLLIERASEVLSENESKVIRLTFFDNLSQKQAGESLGISQMHVSRLQRRALKKLKHALHLEFVECI